MNSHVMEPIWRPSIGLDGRLIPPAGVKEGPSLYSHVLITVYVVVLWSWSIYCAVVNFDILWEFTTKANIIITELYYVANYYYYFQFLFKQPVFSSFRGMSLCDRAASGVRPRSKVT